jgi:hypothetical protein
MSDGSKFQATNPDGSTLSAAPPEAFGFLTAAPAAITVNGSRLGPVPGTLGLIGGPVSITGATLTAPAGTIHITSAMGIGEVPIDPRNKPALTVTSFGPVSISGGSTLNVSDPVNLGSGASVFIRSGALTIDTSQINADNYGAGAGGSVVVSVDGQLLIEGESTANYSGVSSQSRSGGTGGSISVSAGALTIVDASQILSSTVGPGNAGTSRSPLPIRWRSAEYRLRARACLRLQQASFLGRYQAPLEALGTLPSVPGA